ncbi:MAG: hypothetical protein IAF38_20790, partial [Bacteroidia bacterium]|nr:hypothetical protein [Bacteroidia bacterium]
MRLLIRLLLITFFLFNAAVAQNIEGKWYLLHGRGFTEYNIEKDSVKNRQLFFSMYTKSDYVVASKI